MSDANVFLCHAGEDKPLATRLAQHLRAKGIETFFAPWEIFAGDSLRQTIDPGIERCTHFVVLATPRSLAKAWPKAELDAGFTRQLEGKSKLILVRAGLEVGNLPELLRGYWSPSLDDYDAGLTELVNGILRVSEKPPLGVISAAARPPKPDLGLSAFAQRLAMHLVRASETGRDSDPMVEVPQIRQWLEIADDHDLIEAVDDLEGLGLIHVLRSAGGRPQGLYGVSARIRLFAQLDHAWMAWNPADDARLVAARLVAHDSGALLTDRVAKQEGWEPRRMNAAIAFIDMHGAAEISDAIDPVYVSSYLRRNARTRRFVRD